MELVEYTVDGAVGSGSAQPSSGQCTFRRIVPRSARGVHPRRRARDPSSRGHRPAAFRCGGRYQGIPGRPTTPETKENLARSLVDAVAVLDQLEKPTIAAIHGYALGGGLELAMGADFRYLAEDARVGQPEIKLGLIPGAGGTQRLQRLVGFQKAKDLVYTGRQVGAEEALAIGLADRVFPSDQVLDAALEAAGEMATGPTRALTAAKQALAGGHGRPLHDGMELEAQAFDQSFLDGGRPGRGSGFSSTSEPPTSAESERAVELFHFSEDDSITEFVPHIPPTNPTQRAAVWAIDEEHSPLYWFPRQCPRVSVWARNPAEQETLSRLFETEVSPAERDRDRLAASDERAVLYRYVFDGASFEPWYEADGQFVAYQTCARYEWNPWAM